jgi:acetoin utilization protein AcuB
MRGYNDMKIVELMTKNPLVMTPGETVGQADELMTENRIRQLPVVEGSALLGIITDRDVRSFLANSSLADPEERAKALKTKVREVMTADPLTLAPDDDLRDAVELLVEDKIGGIPVVDEAEGLVGIVTYVDVLRCFLNRLDEDQA